jgi:PKD repeat protein
MVNDCDNRISRGWALGFLVVVTFLNCSGPNGQNDPPTAFFSYSVVDEEVQFSDESKDPDGRIIAWHWEFGDGSASTVQNPTYRYENAETYTVILTVTDNDYSTGSCSRSVTITNKSPVAAFIHSVNGSVVEFTDQSTDDGEIVSWVWEFGDGTISTIQNTTHRYEGIGTYEVALTVTDNNGSTNGCSDTLHIVNVSPLASFSFSVATRDVQFTDESIDPNGQIVAWSWAFSDGLSSAIQMPTHHYDNIGSYAVTLTVTDNDGASDSCSDTVKIVNKPPVASFGYSINECIVEFTDQSTDDGDISAWHWEFGDGSVSEVQNPSHQYRVAGDYDVVLVITDDVGARDSFFQSISLTCDFVIYSDSGIPDDAEVLTWSGEDWGGPPSSFDGNDTCVVAPEGTSCFKTTSGSNWTWNTNYAGWGIFLIKPVDHTIDLSAYAYLKFWVKTPENLKVEIQQHGRDGRKSAVYLADYGWDGTDTWQEMTIPTGAFTEADLQRIFSPFLITVEQGDKTFYVDNVRWVD